MLNLKPTVRGMLGLLGLFSLTAEATPTVSVFVSIPPQKYFVERIGGDRVQVTVMVAPGQSPATYDPSPKQIARLSSADLYFRIGVPFEQKWMKHLIKASPNMQVITLHTGIPLRSLPSNHIHQKHPLDHQGNKDPHIWTSPRWVRYMAGPIYQALLHLDPSAMEYYQTRYRNFLVDLDNLDQEIRTIMRPIKHKHFLVFHPSWGYFADTYGLQQWAVEKEGKVPGAKDLMVLVDRARANRFTTIFVQPQFSRKIVNTLAKNIGAEVVEVDPLAQSYIENLKQVSRLFAKAMQ